MRSAALHALARRHDVVVIEGAGSPAEINLLASDYREPRPRAGRPCPARRLLVTDIDRGGAFAHLLRHRPCCRDDRALLRGFVLNRFRGDPGAACARARSSCSTDQRADARRAADVAWARPARRRRRVRRHAERRPGRASVIAVLRLPADQQPRRVPAAEERARVRLCWARTPARLDSADWVVLPGSKHTSSDLAWLRAQGLDAAIAAPCGGRRRGAGHLRRPADARRALSDPHGIDGSARLRAWACCR